MTALALSILGTAAAGCYTSRFEQMDQRMAEIQANLRRLSVQDSIALARIANNDQATRTARAEAASRHDELLQAIDNLRTALTEMRDRPSGRSGRSYNTPPYYAPPDTTMMPAVPDNGSSAADGGGSFAGGAAGPGGDAGAPGGPGVGGTPAVSPGDSAANRPSPGDTANLDDIRASYDAARLDLTRGNFDLAANGFREFLRQYPDAELADNAQYWLGECYYAEKQYQEAATEFGKVVDGFPDGDKVGAALLKLGYCQLALGNKSDGVTLLERVSRDYPGTPEARQADERLERLGAKH